jgi:hypothetical protein
MPPFGAYGLEAGFFHLLFQKLAIGLNGFTQFGCAAVVRAPAKVIKVSAHVKFITFFIDNGEVDGHAAIVHGTFFGVGNVSGVRHFFP